MSMSGSEASFVSDSGSDALGRAFFVLFLFPFFDFFGWGASEGVVTFGLGAFGFGFGLGTFCAGTFTKSCLQAQVGQYFLS